MKIKYPDLRGCDIIAIDIETKDSDLKTKGVGSIRQENGDKITGVSISVEGYSEYYNFAHETENRENEAAYNIEKNMKYVKEVLALPTPKLGMNLAYELAWLTCPTYNMPINGELIDVMVHDYLLYELHTSYSLDNILKRNGFEGKKYYEPYKIALQNGWIKEPKTLTNSDTLEQIVDKLVADKVAIGPHLHKLKWENIREYAIGDTELLLPLYKKQLPQIQNLGLEKAAYIERMMIRLTNEMFQNGSRINVEATEQLCSEWYTQIHVKEQAVYALAGQDFNINSGKQIAEVYDKLGYKYALTPKGRPCFNAEHLAKYPDKISKSILLARLQKDNFSKFPLKFLQVQKDGYIHGQFHSTKNSIKGGTVTSRLSSTNPNLQNIPSQNDKYRIDANDSMAKDVRSLFIPEDGHLWGSIDLSQIEFRTLCHYGVGKGVKEAINYYITDKDADFHNFVIDLTKLPRKPAKQCNFLLVYRGGHKLLAEKLGKPEHYGKKLKEFYFYKLPFVKTTAEYYESKATKEKVLRSLVGRIIHFPDFDSPYSAFSRLNQGSAADFLKAGLVDAWNEGIFDYKNGKLKLHSTIHDENNVSIPPTAEGKEAFYRLQKCMENPFNLKVPVYATAGTGDNWYLAKAD